MSECKHFRGDRPCKFYWIDRSWNCGICKHRDSYSGRILLIKLDTFGDVLRSSPVAEGLKKKYPYHQLTWLVKEECNLFLKKNRYIDRVKFYNEETIRILQCEKFNIIINLDKDAKSTSLMNIFNGVHKYGYGISSEGHVVPIDERAKYQYNICLDNWGTKLTNEKTYLEMLFNISNIEYFGEKPFLILDKEKNDLFKQNFFLQNNIKSNDKIIILNTGCGPVYPHKKWTYDGYKELIKLLLKQNYKIILTGAGNESERNKSLIDEFPINTTFNVFNLIDTTNKYSIEELCFLIDLCDLIVTGDTMAMHIGIALNKKLITFFGPSPHQETNLFGLGVKMVRKELACLSCHDQFACPYNGKCMSLISANDVHEQIQKLIQ